MRIDRLESDLSAAHDARAELDSALAACRDSVMFALSQLAREVERAGGNPDLADTQTAADELISDMAYDGYARIDERIMDASLPLGNEYRKQGVG